MNILVISSSYPRFKNDQIGFFIHELNKELSKYYNITVIVPSYNGKKYIERIDNVRIIRFQQFPIFNISLSNPEYGMFETIKKSPLKIFVLFSYLYNLIKCTLIEIKKEKFDIIHYHWIFPNSIIDILIKIIFKKLNTIVTIHGSDYWGFNNGIKKKIKFHFLRKIKNIVCVNNSMIRDIQKNTLILNTYNIPIGINTQNFNMQSKLKVSKSLDILFVGKANKAKGFDILINSISKLRALNNDIKLIAITQSIDTDLINILEHQLIFEFTTLTGRIANNEIIPYYQNCDIFILPSLSEGWPVVVMEALSCGCICIVTDIPAFEEYKDKYEFLHIVEKANPQALADKILQIHNNYEYYKSFKQDARDFAVNNFDWKIITKKYLDVFEEILNEKN